MTHFRDPAPRPDKPDYVPVPWPSTIVVQCPSIVSPAAILFSTVFEGRRSRYPRKRVCFRDIINVLAYAHTARYWLGSSPQGLAPSLRPAMSAGALHPIHIILVRSAKRPRLFRYDGYFHCLELLECNNIYVWKFIRKIGEFCDDTTNDIVVFVGDIEHISSKYENYESLLWRDAGCLLQVMALSCEAHGFAFRPLATLGAEVPDALGLKTRLTALGVAVLGL